MKNAYWDLAYAINNAAAQRQSLELAEQSLKDNEKRVQIGTMAPIDIVQAQAEVASNQQNVIVADAAIKTAEDSLRALIFDPANPDFWTIKIEPTDTAPFQESAIDVDAAVRNALSKRSDLDSARNSIEQSDVNIRYFRNQILPDVNAQVNYGTFGLGGVQLSSVDPFGNPSAPRTILTQSGYGSVLGDVFSAAYPQWSVGVQIGYPLGSSTSHANLARAKLQFQQAQTQIKSLELQIVTQVRNAARQVQTNAAAREVGARLARAAGKEARRRAEEVRGRHVDQLLRLPGAARSGHRPHARDPGDLGLQQVARRLRRRAGGPAERRRRRRVTAGAGAIQTGGSAIIRSGGN